MSFLRSTALLATSVASSIIPFGILQRAIDQNFNRHLTMASPRREVEIIKSGGDERNYRGLVLENGMKIVLVSDPTTDKAAAALDVNIGSMSDPVPGLAHFCEHMLFLGTKKYQAENEYNRYLSQHNGSCNAYTASDHTNYYFDISPDYLGGALDRFGQFFLEPLFTDTATERELNAVHSEHSKNVASDAWRINQLERHLGDPTHDYYKFGTGNLSTLDEIPKSKGMNIRDELLKFHSTWYSSNIMSLAVLGKESLDDLEKMVADLFNNVSNKNVEGPSWPHHPYLPKDNRTITYIVPIKDIRNLDILFPIPDLRDDYKSGPVDYLSHLIGHEGKGSLLSELKERKWCNSLVAGQKSGAKGFSFFEVGVDLTVEGVNHIDDIVSLLFQYLTMLREQELQKWVFEECHDINEMMFRFKDKERPQGYATTLANRIHTYQLEDVLKGPYMLTDWKPDLVNDILSRLTPSNVRILAIAQKYEDIATDSEPWYGTKHKTEEIKDELLKQWEAPASNEKLHLPEKNPFVPTNFELCERDNYDSRGAPSVIYDSSLSRVWFKQDDEFLLPKASLNFQIMSSLAYADPEHANLNYLFTQLFKDDINEFLYPAELAGMNYSMSNTKYGINVGVGGYHDKQKILLEKIFTRLTEYKVDEDRFRILKEAYIRGLKNFKMEQPYSHSSYHNNILLAERIFTKEELLESVENLDHTKIQPFIQELFGTIHIESLMFGNLTAETALEYAKVVEDTLAKGFGSKQLPKSLRVKDREYSLPPKTSLCQTLTNEVHKTSCIETIYQVGVQNTRDNILIELFIQLINEPCFNILRTQEQLGYIVWSGTRRSCGTQGVRVIIQSDREPKYLDARIEKFMHSMRDFIKDMAEEEFETNKKGLIDKRLEKPKKLSSRAGRFWNEIVCQQYNFDRDDIETEAMKEITKTDILNFFDTYICPKSEERKKLTCYIVPSDTSEIKIETIPEMEVIPKNVTDANTLKSSLSLFAQATPMKKPEDMVRTME